MKFIENVIIFRIESPDFITFGLNEFWPRYDRNFKEYHVRFAKLRYRFCRKGKMQVKNERINSL